MKTTASHIVLPSLLLLVCADTASAQVAISWQTIDGGGGIAQNGSLRAHGTIGQPDPEVMTAGSLAISGGFWFHIPEPVPCYADCDYNGVLNIFDYICFGNLYAAGDPYADCDGSGSLNVFDYICFGNEYAAGCP